MVSSSLSVEESGGKTAASLSTYTDKFNELFPFYLCIGMTAKQYWEEDSTLVIAYRKADEMRRERQNQSLWLQGVYFYEALGRISPILQAFAKKGTKPKPYISEPYSITQKRAEIKQEENAKKTFNKGKMFMEKLLADNNKKFGRGENNV